MCMLLLLLYLCPCRQYVHLYQQKLDALQPQATPAPAATAAEIPADSTSTEKADSKTAAGPVPGTAADGSLFAEANAARQAELHRLEQQLCVEDILLCRSLAELALERRSSSSGESLLPATSAEGTLFGSCLGDTTAVLKCIRTVAVMCTVAATLAYPALPICDARERACMLACLHRLVP